MSIKKIAFLVILMIITGTAIFIWKSNSGQKQASQTPSAESPSQTKTVSATDKPQVVSTKPDPLNETIISAVEKIEITFNRSLENAGEFKVRIEPKVDYKIELSDDRKTAKIIPATSYELGTTYTLFIGTETKFDGVGRWGEEKVYHFKTITYRGV